MTPEINLLPKIDHKDDVKSKVPYFVLASVAILLLAYFTYAYFSASSKITTLTAEEAVRQAEVDEALATLTQLEESNKGTLEGAVGFVKEQAYAVTPLMDEVTKQLPPNTYLREYNFTEEAVTLTVDLETMRDVSFYIERLVKSDYFVDAQIIDVSAFELGETEKEQKPSEKFNFIPRYTVTITALIDYVYLKGGAK